MNEFFTLCTVFIKMISLIYDKINFSDRVLLSSMSILFVCEIISRPLIGQKLATSPGVASYDVARLGGH